jgi:hypothetical protein
LIVLIPALKTLAQVLQSFAISFLTVLSPNLSPEILKLAEAMISTASKNISIVF